MASASTVRALLSKHDLPPEVEELSHRVIGAAIEVHKELGPGLLESVYEEALVHELGIGRIAVHRQAEVPVTYKGIQIKGQRLDLLIEGLIVVEIKSVATLLDVHAAQLLSYLRAAGLPLGLLFNFNVPLLKDGMKRVFNERVVSLVPLIQTSSSPSRSSR